MITVTSNSRKAIIGLGIAVLFTITIFSLFVHFNDDSIDFDDRNIRVIVTDSMDGERQTDFEIETIPKDSLVMIHRLDKDELTQVRIGDILSFHTTVNGREILDCHRVLEVYSDGQSITGFKTQGDRYADTSNYEMPSADETVGVVVGVSPTAGTMVHSLQSNAIFWIMALVVLVVMASAALDLVKVRRADKES